MPLTEPQISTLLGYIAEPVCNKLSAEVSQDLKAILIIFEESEKQKDLQLRPLVQQRWIDFLPWHSIN
ncbi:MAG: hypothetical protein HEQ32_05585 [Vampirovibrio sp.]|jgi:hypothetical protein